MTTPLMFNVGPDVNLGKHEEIKEWLRRRLTAGSNEVNMEKEKNDYAETGK